MRWILLLALGSLVASSQVHLRETGSSLLFPVITRWAQVYHAKNASVDLSTEATGSGAGIKGASDGSVDIGASDAYLTSDQMQAAGVMNIAVTISAQTIDYNIPEVSDAHLQFTPALLARIYDGTVRFWDDAQITAINKDVAAKLPHAAIVPVVRSDSAGDTFLFTQYLVGDADWKSKVGFGTTVKWPAVDAEQTAKGNGGVLKLCGDTKYALCYLGISFLVQASGTNLHYAALQNPSGNYVLPSVGAIGAAAIAMIDQTPKSESISLVNCPAPDSYPIVNYEYAIVKVHQKDAAVAKALRDFLGWGVGPKGGNDGQNLTPGFTSLPPAIEKMSRAQIALIQ